MTTLIVQPSPFTYGHRGRIVASAMTNGLATIFAFPVAAREEFLIAYGPDYLHMYSRAPFYVDRILRGTKPADLLVDQPRKIEFVVNLRTAKALGIEVPLSLLVGADELLEWCNWRSLDAIRSIEPAPIHHAAQRLDRRVAARCTRTAVGNAGNRISQRRVAR